MLHDDPTGSMLPARLPSVLSEAAAVYAAAGIAVFPCVPGGKEPLTEHGFHNATTDLAQIQRWWRWQPEANIGLATGHGIEVLDVDVHALATGYQALRQLQREGMTAGWALAVRSPSEGLHLYYPSDPGREQRSWSRGNAHIDFRGSGGYIIAPPSRINTGSGDRSYEVIARGRSPHPVDTDAIRDRLTPPRPALPQGRPSSAPSGQLEERLTEWVTRLPEGNRNAGVFWAACRLAEAGYSEADMRAVLDSAAQSTGLDAREIAQTVRSAHRTAQSLAPDDPGERATSPTASASAMMGIGR